MRQDELHIIVNRNGYRTRVLLQEIAMFTDEYQKMLHARSMNNRGALLDSRECGCFFCIKMYNPEKITEWISDETAKCAFCGVDAVIPESYDYELSDSLLLAMKEYWF